MTREQKLQQLEELCQQRYSIIDSCYLTIKTAQQELEKLEAKYLKLKAKLDTQAPVKHAKRQTKIEKLKKSLLKAGLDENTISEVLDKIK